MCPLSCGTCGVSAPQAVKAPQGVKAPQATKAPKSVKAPQAVKAPSPVEAKPGTRMAHGAPSCLDTATSIAKDENGKDLNCTDLVAHCNHAENGATVKKLCPATCGVCTAAYR